MSVFPLSLLKVFTFIVISCENQVVIFWNKFVILDPKYCSKKKKKYFQIALVHPLATSKRYLCSKVEVKRTSLALEEKGYM